MNQGHSWPIMRSLVLNKGNEMNDSGPLVPAVVQDMLKRGDLQRQITPPPPPPPPPPHKSLGTQRELMAKISGKSQNIIKWCKNMWQYIIYFVTLEMGKLTGQKLKPRHFLLFYPGFTVVGLICWGIRFSNTVFSFQNKQESQLTKENNEISCSNIFS